MTGGGPNYEPAEGKPVPEELLLPPRRERIDDVVSKRTRTLTVVLDQLEDAFNMAAVLRTCEGMGLQEVHVVKNPEHPWSPNAKVTQGCEKWLDITQHEDFASCAAALKARGFRVLVSAVRSDSTSLFDLTFDDKVALVFGNERFGVSSDVIAHADGTFWIPMRGFTQSFNVSAAACASITRAVSWRLEHHGVEGDLTGPERTALRERFSFLSVKQRGKVYATKAPRGRQG